MPQSIRRLSTAAAQIVRANLDRRPSSPFKLNLALTYWCQYKCKTCNIWRKRPTDELTTNELVKLMRGAHGVCWLDLTGGEIFLREDVDDVLGAAVADTPDLSLLHFPTNGFLTDRIVASVTTISQTPRVKIVVTVSVDGDEAVNDRVRGIQGGYKRQIETFNALRNIPGVHAVIGMTLSTYNAGQFERTFAACQRDCPGLEISDFHVNLAQQSAHYYDNANSKLAGNRDAIVGDLALYRKRRRAAHRPLSRLASRWVEERYLDKLDRFIETGVTPMRCHALRSSCFVDPWGTVYPCISYSRPLGQLRDMNMDLVAFWRGETAEQVQREIWSGDCPQCWTACEAYPSILGNLLTRRRAAGEQIGPHGPREQRLKIFAS